MRAAGDAIRALRADDRYVGLVRDSYLDEAVAESAERFRGSAEFSEVLGLLKHAVRGATVLDMGAGNGIASYAFAQAGAKVVYALEPDPDEDVGRGAILRLRGSLPIELIDGFGEQIPLPGGSVDVVYTRQVLHHTRDLPKVLRECARVLRSGGKFLACREHVADDEEQLKRFLAEHPINRFTGSENAFPLSAYLDAVDASGLEVVSVLGPWDSVINAYPAVKKASELRVYPRLLLERRLGGLGALAGRVPGITALVWARLKRPVPGRLYSFLAIKR